MNLIQSAIMSKKDAKFLGTFYITVSVRMCSIFKSNFMESRILAFTGWSTLIQDISNLESRINIRTSVALQV